MYRENMATAMQKWLPFRMVSGMGPDNCVLDGREHWCHLINTVEILCVAAITGFATRDGN